MPDLIIPGWSDEENPKDKVYRIPDHDYDRTVSEIRSEGGTFELVADPEAIVGDPEAEVAEDAPEFLGFQDPSPALAVEEEAVSGPPQIEGLDPEVEKKALDAAYELEMATRADVEKLDMAKLEKDVRRVANSTLVPGAEFLPGGSSPMSLDTYKHFEPPVRMAIDASADEADRADMIENGASSPAYQAYAGQQWKLVHNVHRKHNLPVVRVERLEGSDSPYSSIASGLGTLTKEVTTPLMLGFDQIAAASIGKQAMGAAYGEFASSPAIEELEGMGVISDQTGRLEEIGEESPWVQGLGGIIGLPTMIPQLIERGAAKIGGAVTSRPLAQAAVAGAAGTGGELLAEGLVEEGVEALGGREATLPTEEDAIQMMLMGAGMGAGGSLIGSAGDKYQDWIRHPDTAGGPDLNQMEALLQDVPRAPDKHRQRVGKPVRATSVTKPGGLNPGEVVEEAKQRVATQRMRPREGFAEKVEDIYIEPVEQLGKQLTANEDKLRKTISREAKSYHMSREGRQPQSTAPILARLEAMKAKTVGGIREVTDIGEAETLFAGAAEGASPGSELPLMKPKMLNDLIDGFKRHPQMNAGQLDDILEELDGLMFDNKSTVSNNRLLADLSLSMRKVRDKFFGNVHTGGDEVGGWSALKKRQSDKLQSLEASRDRLGLSNVSPAQMDLPTQRKVAINAVKSLGEDASSADIYKVLTENPKLKARLQEVLTNEPHTRIMRGGTEAIVNRSAAARSALSSAKYRFDPIAELLSDGMRERGGLTGQLGAIGTGSERSEAASGRAEEDKSILMKMLDALRSRPAENEDRR